MTTTTTKTRPVWGCPAATLTLPVDAPQDAWHAQRSTGVGGSEIGVITGLATYPGTNRYTLWQEKTGEVTEPVYDQATLDRFRFGHAMEDTLAAWWSEDTGLTTRRAGSYRSKTVEYALANPDRLTSDGGVLEIKTTSGYTDTGKTYLAGDVPAQHYAQANWYAGVLGRRGPLHFIALVDRTPVILQRDPDPELYREHVASAGEFWEAVTTGTPPETLLADMTDSELSARYPESTPDTVTVTQVDFLVRDELARRTAAIEQKKAAEAEIKRIDTALKAEIGDSEYLALPDGERVARWQTVAGRKRVDTDRLLADYCDLAGVSTDTSEYGDILDRYTTHGKPSRRFTII